MSCNRMRPPAIRPGRAALTRVGACVVRAFLEYRRCRVSHDGADIAPEPLFESAKCTRPGSLTSPRYLLRKPAPPQAFCNLAAGPKGLADPAISCPEAGDRRKHAPVRCIYL